MLPAIYHDVILESLKNKRLLAIAVIYFIAVALIFVEITHAFFTDSATSSGNSFTAAAEFPTATPTPTGSVTPTPPENIANHIVISEVQIDGGTDDANNHDFIELYNPSNSLVSLDGMRLVKRTTSAADTNIFTFNSTHTIPAHGFFLWAHSSIDNNFAATISANVDSSDTLATNNGIALRNGAIDVGTIIDSLAWGTSGAGALTFAENTAFTPNPTENQSIERKALSTSDAASMSGSDAAKGNGYDTDTNSTDFVLRPTSQPQNSSSTTESP